MPKRSRPKITGMVFGKSVKAKSMSSKVQRTGDIDVDIQSMQVKGRAHIEGDINETIDVGGAEKSNTQGQNQESLESDCFGWKIVTTEDNILPYERAGKTGVLLICNSFIGSTEAEPRVGAEIDVRKLKAFFGKLNCHVITKENITSEAEDESRNLDVILKEFKTELIRMNSTETEYIYDSCIVIIMSHNGKTQNTILMGDMTEKNLYKDIVYKFGPTDFHAFRGKPKIFIVQVCQNGRDPVPSATDDSAVADDPPDHSLLCFATMPYTAAKRSREEGSVFIQKLTDVFNAHWQKRSLKTMLIEVEEKVRLVSGQVACTKSCGGFKDFMFNKYVGK